MKSKQILRNVLICVPIVLAVAACGGGGGRSDKVQNPPALVVTTAQEDKFGVAFGAAFRAAADSEPKDVNEGDLVPVSWTTEPIDITP